jgi:hypothetical protein
MNYFFDDHLVSSDYALEMDYDEVVKLERKLLDSSVRKSAEELSSLLSSDFVEFGTSGRTYNRKMIIEQLAEELPSTVEALDFKSVLLAPDVIQLRFKTRRKNEDGTMSASLRSSIWKFTEGQWQMLFHQGTATPP